RVCAGDADLLRPRTALGDRGTDRSDAPLVIRLRASVRSIADSVLAVVLAPACAACGGLLDRPTDGPICGPCWQSILPLTPPLCDRCGDPLPTWRAHVGDD